MKRASNRGYVPASRQWSGVSARRGEQERRRQEELREMFNGNWYLAHRQARLEREAAEANTTTDTTSTEGRADNTERRGVGRGQ